MFLKENDIGTICRYLKISRSLVHVNYIKANTPSLILTENGCEINIVDVGQYWNLIYQFSHEMLHFAFRLNSPEQYPEARWIEEILCEAVSILCLYLDKKEYIKWCGYKNPRLYILNGNIQSCDLDPSIRELNQLLFDFKTYETRQFIQPLVVEIFNILYVEPEQIYKTFNMSEYINKDRIDGSKIGDSEILKLIFDFQNSLKIE